jgi:putative ABC transport system permease protein
VEPEPFLRMYPEYLLPEEERMAWIADRSGALIGRGLADLTGWKPGDVIPLRSAIWQRSDGSDVWELTVRAVYDLPEGGDTRQILLHQEYFEEAKAQAKGLIGWYLVQVDRVDRAATVARQIDLQFANSPAETKTSSERAMAQSFLNQIGNIGAILRAIVTAVFFTMLLVTANTIAQSVRERTSEIGVLKTLGFSSGGVLALVLSESVLITVIGGTLGLAGAAWLGVQFEPVFRQYLPGFSLPTDAVLLGFVLMVVLGVVAGAVPAVQAMRLRIVQALRRD